MGWDANPNALLSTSKKIARMSRSGKNQSHRPWPEISGKGECVLWNRINPIFQFAQRSDMDDNRMISWPTFDLINPCHCTRIFSIGPNSIDRLSGEDDELSITKRVRCSRQCFCSAMRDDRHLRILPFISLFTSIKGN